jgi:hypothetical protein
LFCHTEEALKVAEKRILHEDLLFLSHGNLDWNLINSPKVTGVAAKALVNTGFMLFPATYRNA